MRYATVFFSFTIMAMCLSSISSAAVLEYYSIDAEIERNLHTKISVSMKPSDAINHFDYDIPFTIYNLTVEPQSGTHACDFDNERTSSVISCDFFGATEGNNGIKFTFYSRDAVNSNDGKYIFQDLVPFIMDTEDFFTLLKLPERSSLSEEIVNQSLFPPDGRIFTDGKHMFIVWERENVTSGDSLIFSASFESSSDGGILWSMTVVGITAIVVMVMVSVGFYMRRGSGETKTEVKVLPLLNKEEKKVVDILVKHEGEVRQREIVRESDFSKAKVSRLIKNLKERGVIDTDAISGRENKVILKIKGVE